MLLEQGSCWKLCFYCEEITAEAAVCNFFSRSYSSQRRSKSVNLERGDVRISKS